jgi:hypothetical protein
MCTTILSRGGGRERFEKDLALMREEKAKKCKECSCRLKRQGKSSLLDPPEEGWLL